MTDDNLKIRFNFLIAQLQLETGVRHSQRKIAREIEMAESTVSRFATGKTNRFDSELLVKIVDYFNKRLNEGCDLSDLITYQPEKQI